MPKYTESGDVIYDDITNIKSGKLTLDNQNGHFEYPRSVESYRLYRKGVRRPKPKWLDDTPYERFQRSFTGFTGSLTYDQGETGTYSGLFSDEPWGSNFRRARFKPNGNEVNSEYGDVALVKALAALNYKDVDLGTFVKEAGKTADLVYDVAMFSVRALRALKRRDVAQFRNLFRSDVTHRLPTGQTVVDAYLTYHYGVKPLLQDVAGGVQALTRLPPEEWRVRAKGSYANEAQKTTRNIECDAGFVNAKTSYRESAKAVVHCTRRPTTVADDRRWALGLDDPLSTAWEITPFSFVVDWLFPIGDWLAAINASKYFTDWNVSVTDYIRETTTYSGISKYQPISGHWIHTTGSGSCESLYIKRRASSTIPIVGPPMKNPVSIDHMAKGLSLLATTLARGGELNRYLRV